MPTQSPHRVRAVERLRYSRRVSDYPNEFMRLFEPSFVEYANAETQGTLDAPPSRLVHRVHVIASPTPGLVTVCRSVEEGRFLPGGRLEIGETMAQAIEREMFEEAGSIPVGEPKPFFSHIATSRSAAPYLPHVPHPVTWWTYVVTQSRVIAQPSKPADGEHITEVHHLPANDAAAWLAQDESDTTHADVVRLAAHLRMI